VSDDNPMATAEPVDPETRAGRLKDEGWDLLRLAWSIHRELWRDAEDRFGRAEKLLREAGDRAGLVDVLGGRAGALRLTGDPERIRTAVACYEEEIEILRSLGRPKEAVEHGVSLLAAYRDLAALSGAEAATLLAKAVGLGRTGLATATEMGDRPLSAAYCNAIGELCSLMSGLDPELQESHLKTAMAFYRQAIDLWGDQEDDGKVGSRMGLAETYIRLNTNLEHARELLQSAQLFYESPGHRVEYQVAQIKTLLSMMHEVSGDAAQAADLRAEAVVIFRRMGFEV
jgi:tetratricopeptide (TPR) repeat protein